MSLKRYLVNKFTGILPPTKFYQFKRALYIFSGVDIQVGVKIVSSVQMWGAGKIDIGKDTYIGHEVLLLSGKSSISIGREVDIGPRVTIVNGTHKIDMLNLRSAGSGYSKEISIGSGVWIGAGSTILNGIKIGKESVVAAGSLVNEDIPEKVIAAGVPCKPIKIWSEEEACWKKINDK